MRKRIGTTPSQNDRPTRMHKLPKMWNGAASPSCHTYPCHSIKDCPKYNRGGFSQSLWREELIHHQIAHLALDALLKGFDAAEPDIEAFWHYFPVAHQRLVTAGSSVLCGATKACSRRNTEVSDVLAHGGQVTAVLTCKVGNIPDHNTFAARRSVDEAAGIPCAGS